MKTISDYLHSIQYADYDPAEKETLVKYMTQRDHLYAASTGRIKDRITGERLESVCYHLYSDGEYEWTSEEAYLVEKHGLKVSDEFFSHVIQKRNEEKD